MKILLVTLHCKNVFTPLALLYLKTFLAKDTSLCKKTEIEIEEFSIYDTDDFILHRIQKHNPHIIGFSCYVWNIGRILFLARDIKKLNKDVKIVLGGPQVSPIAKALLEENKSIDIIVKGEGELAFLKLIKSLLNSGRSFNKIPGITYRRNKKIIDNAGGEVIRDLDSIPSPYLAGLISLEDRDICLETQRGCIFKCHFCYYDKGFDGLRFFSMERVKKDISFLLGQRLRSIYLMDPVFNVNAERAKDISRFIIQNNKNKVMFHTEIRAELVDEELAELFYRANIKYLEIGLQSSSGKTSRLINRPLDAEKFKRGINFLKKYDGLYTEIQLIVGLPGDTFRSFEKSLEFALALEPTTVRVARLQVLPGTKIWSEAKRLGIIYEDNPPHYFLKGRGFSFGEAVQTQKIINGLDLFGGKAITKYLCKESRTKLLDFINLWIEWNNDDSLLLNYTDNLKDKFKKFVRYFCEKNNIDFNFYDILLRKENEAEFCIKNGKELIEVTDKRYHGK